MSTIILTLQAERDIYQAVLTQTKALLENYCPEDLLLIRLTDSVSALEGKVFSLEKDLDAWKHVLNKFGD